MSDVRDESVGFFYSWWRGDGLPAVSPPPAVVIETANDDEAVAQHVGTDPETVRERIATGQSPWIARVAGEIAGIGWVAAREAEIGELGLRFRLPPADRYLWDFVTLPVWRGRNIYPAMLQAILRRVLDGERFWIGHDLSNVASGRGIIKAGFQKAGAVHQSRIGDLVFVSRVADSRAKAAAEILGIPLKPATADDRARP